MYTIPGESTKPKELLPTSNLEKTIDTGPLDVPCPLNISNTVSEAVKVASDMISKIVSTCNAMQAWLKRKILNPGCEDGNKFSL